METSYIYPSYTQQQKLYKSITRFNDFGGNNEKDDDSDHDGDHNDSNNTTNNRYLAIIGSSKLFGLIKVFFLKKMIWLI